MIDQVNRYTSLDLTLLLVVAPTVALYTILEMIRRQVYLL